MKKALLLLMAFANIVYASKPLLTFVPLTSTTVSVPGNGTANVQYTVTNQSNRPHSFLMSTITGVSQITSGSGVCGSTFTLSSHASCTLSLQIDGAQVASGIAKGDTNGPIVCDQINTLQCYKPSLEDTLKITVTENSYSVGGSITNLEGTIYLQNNGANPQAYSTNGSFTLVTGLRTGAAYNVTVQTQPTNQYCSVLNGSGTINNANVTNIEVVCYSNQITPDYGPSSGGTSVTITGKNLSNTTSVTFGGVAGTITSTSDTQVVVTTPAYTVTSGNYASVDVAVTADGRTRTNINGFIYYTNPLSITPTTIPSGTIGQSYSVTFSSSGGVSPYTYTSTTLPPGLALSSSGVLSGTPTFAGSYTFTITTTDSNGWTGSQNYSLTVSNNMFITPTQFHSATARTYFTQTFTANGGTYPYTYQVSLSPTTSGLVMDASTGVLSGIPPVPGEYAFTITATDIFSNTITQTFNLQVYGDVLVYPTSLPFATVGSSYSVTFTSTGGSSYTYTSTGTLPPGLTLNSGTGVLSGTPSTNGTYNFTIISTDASTLQIGVQMYNLVVQGTVTITPSLLNSGYVNQTYSDTLTGSGGTSPYTFSVKSGDVIPPGLTLNSNGSLSGTPLWANNYIFSVNAQDSSVSTKTGTNRYALAISNPSLTLNPANNSVLPNSIINTSYSTTIYASQPSVFSIASPQGLPPGCILVTAGDQLSVNISCAQGPTVEGIYLFTLQAIANNQTYGTSYANYKLVVNGAATLTPQILPDGQYGATYTSAGNPVVLTLTGSGLSNISFYVSDQSLPPGLTLTSNSPTANQATISGTPSALGSYSFAIRADYTINSASSSTTQPYTIDIQGVALTLSPSSGTLYGTINQQFTQTFTASGGNGNYTYTLANSNLPSGFVLNSTTGVLTGQASSSDNYSFSILVQDTAGNTGYAPYNLNIQGNLSISPTTLTNGMVGIFYSTQLSTTGGSGTGYTYSLSTGALPPGLSLSSNGLISGTPILSTTSPSEFTVQVTDSLNDSTTQNYTLSISDVLISANAGNSGTPPFFNICTVDSDNTLSNCTAYNSSAFSTSITPMGIAISQRGYIYSYSVSNSEVFICSIPNGVLTCNSVSTGISGWTGSNNGNVAINNNYLYITNDVANQVAVCQITPSTTTGETIKNCVTTGSTFTTPIGLNIYNQYAYISNTDTNSSPSISICPILSDGTFGSCSNYGAPNSNVPTSIQFNNNMAYISPAFQRTPDTNYILKAVVNSDGTLGTWSNFNALSSVGNLVVSTGITNSAYYIIDSTNQLYIYPLDGSTYTSSGSGFLVARGNIGFK